MHSKSYSELKKDYKHYKDFFESEVNSLEGEPLFSIEEIHNNLEYFKISQPELIKYYELEYKLALINMSKNMGYSIDRHYTKYVEVTFNQLLNKLYKRLIATIEVWLLRELYYMHTSIVDVCKQYSVYSEICGSSDICGPGCQHYKCNFSYTKIKNFFRIIYYGIKEDLDSSIYVEAESNNSGEGSTSISTYQNILSIFKASAKMNTQSRFNILLNLAHNNGCMVDKLIDEINGKTAEDILVELTNGYVEDKIRKEFYKETGIPFFS